MNCLIRIVWGPAPFDSPDLMLADLLRNVGQRKVQLHDCQRAASSEAQVMRVPWTVIRGTRAAMRQHASGR
jgi:hypothetical protein